MGGGSRALGRIRRVLRRPGLRAVRVTWVAAKDLWAVGRAASRGVVRDREAMHLVQAWRSGRLPRLPLAAVFPGIERVDAVAVRKPEARGIGTSLDMPELAHCLAIVKFTGAGSVLELGTYHGFATLNIAANLGAHGSVCTVDLPRDRAGYKGTIANVSGAAHTGAQFRGEPEAARIRQVWADSTTADWGTFGGPFDLILIDAAHEYEYVRSDSRNALAHLRPGGTILWHDYGFIPQVSRAVDELARDLPIVAIVGTRLACYRRPGTA